MFVAIEVGSRLWTSTVVGRRSYRNTLALVRDVASRMTFTTCPVIVTDGFEFYGTVIRRVFGPAALYAQVIKTRRHDRVVRVERRAVQPANGSGPEGDALPMPRDAQRTVSHTWRPEYRSDYARRDRAHPTRRHEARPLLAGRQGRTSAPVAATEGLPSGADAATRLTDHPVEWCGRRHILGHSHRSCSKELESPWLSSLILMPLNVGSRLAHYDVTALIGEEGMGQVYQATDTKLNRQVALKILPEAFAADPNSPW